MFGSPWQVYSAVNVSHQAFVGFSGLKLVVSVVMINTYFIFDLFLCAGSYFASHFIMGGEKFDSTHPEGYLFGENTDLNFLGTRPVAVG